MSVDLPPNWVCRTSRSRNGRQYYYNTETGVSTWTKPKQEESNKPITKGEHPAGSKKRKNASGSHGGGSHSKKKALSPSSFAALKKDESQNEQSTTSAKSAGSGSPGRINSSKTGGNSRGGEKADNHDPTAGASGSSLVQTPSAQLSQPSARAKRAVLTARRKADVREKFQSGIKNDSGWQGTPGNSESSPQSKHSDSDTVINAGRISQLLVSKKPSPSRLSTRGLLPAPKTSNSTSEQSRSLPGTVTNSVGDSNSDIVSRAPGGKKRKAKRKARRKSGLEGPDEAASGKGNISAVGSHTTVVGAESQVTGNSSSKPLCSTIEVGKVQTRSAHDLPSSSHTSQSVPPATGTEPSAAPSGPHCVKHQGNKTKQHEQRTLSAVSLSTLQQTQTESRPEIPVVREQPNSSDSQSMSHAKNLINKFLPSSHNHVVVSGSPQPSFTGHPVVSLTPDALKPQPPPVHATNIDLLLGQDQITVTSGSEEDSRVCYQNSKEKKTPVQRIREKARNTLSQSAKMSQTPTTRFKNQRAQLEDTERNRAQTVKNFKINHSGTESAKASWTPINHTRSNQTGPSDPQPGTKVKSNRSATTSTTEDQAPTTSNRATLRLLNTPASQFTFSLERREPFTTNSLAVPPSLGPVDDQRNVNVWGDVNLNTSINSVDKNFSFQDADLERYTSIDLGSSVADANRVIEDMDVEEDGTAATLHTLLLVIDTNVLIDSLLFLEKLISTSVPGYGNPTYVLPWVVIQELDHLKVVRKTLNTSNQNIHRLAAAAVRFIHTHLMAKNPHVKGQTPQEANEKTDLPIEMNDDKILHCCLQYQSKFPSSRLCLLTRDINLSNKATIMGIDATSDTHLWSFLKTSNPMRRNDKTSLGNPLSEMIDSTKSKPFKEEIKSNKASPLLEHSSESKVNTASFPTRSESENQDVVLRDESVTTRIQSNNDTLQGKTNVVSSFSSTSNNPVSVPHQKQTPTPEQVNAVFLKFESVWKLIFDVKNQAGEIVSKGKVEPRYDEAVKTVRTVSSMVSKLYSEFDKCMAFSPFILQDNPEHLVQLCSALNIFFDLSGVTTSDPTAPVTVQAMVTYFRDTKNRILLMSGLEQLESFSTELKNLMNSIS